jgi:hypothetical protein
VNTRDRGYAVVELTIRGLRADFRVVSTVTQLTATVRTDFTLERAIDDAGCVVAPTTSTSTTMPDGSSAPPPADPIDVAPDFAG